jgi:hypothetical protein
MPAACSVIGYELMFSPQDDSIAPVVLEGNLPQTPAKQVARQIQYMNKGRESYFQQPLHARRRESYQDVDDEEEGRMSSSGKGSLVMAVIMCLLAMVVLQGIAIVYLLQLLLRKA